MADAAGINVFGYVFAESGTGEHTRLLIEAIQCAGIPVAVVPYENTGLRQKHQLTFPTVEQPVYDVNIIGVNADQLPAFARDFGLETFEGRYNIGLWAWEVDIFPERFVSSELYLDEIWSNSHHSGFAITSAVKTPVVPFPLPIRAPRPTAAVELAPLNLPDGFTFLFCFDFLSVFERKNPLAVVEAFTHAFTPGEGPHLVIKSVNAEHAREGYDQLRRAAGDRPDIHLRDGYVDSGIQAALMAHCDAYVSLHRAEGFGLTMAEAMALGKPVIATGYSGNLDFMSGDNSYLVPWELVRVPEGCEPYPTEAHWAEPDIEVAAQHMREIWAGGAAVEHRATAARESVLTQHSPGARAAFIKSRYLHARRQLGLHRGLPPDLPILRQEDAAETTSGPTASPHQLDLDGLDDRVRRVEELIIRGPALTAPTSLGALGRTMRSITYRILRNYDLHQREIAEQTVAVLREVRQQLELCGNALEHSSELAAAHQTLARQIDELARFQTLLETQKRNIEIHLGTLQSCVDTELVPTFGDLMHQLTELARRLPGTSGPGSAE